MNRRTSACLRDLYKITQHKKGQEEAPSSKDDRKNPKLQATEISTVPTRPVKLKRSGNINYPNRPSVDRAGSKTSLVPTAPTTQEAGTAASFSSYHNNSTVDIDGSSLTGSEEAFGTLTMLNPRATKRARKERPRIRQKPGLTAKGEARKFVKHDYTDHSLETHHVIPDNDDSIFENYLDFKETHIKEGVAKKGGNGQPSDHTDGNAMSNQVVESAETGVAPDAVASNPESGSNVSSPGKPNNEMISKIFGSKKMRTAPFPLKLHVLLYFMKENEYTHIASWLKHGRAFRIFDAKQFEEVIMSRFYSMSKITSFHRQLNLYGFRRLTHGKDEGAYYHEYFLRGKPYLTVHISRTKVKGTKIRAASSPDDEPDFYTMPFVNPLDGTSQANAVQPQKLPASATTPEKFEEGGSTSSSSSSAKSMKDKRDKMNDMSMRRKGGVYNGWKGGVYNGSDAASATTSRKNQRTETTIVDVKSTSSCYTGTEDRCFSPLPFSETGTVPTDPILPASYDNSGTIHLKRKGTFNEGVNKGEKYSTNSGPVQPLPQGSSFQVPAATNVQYIPQGTQYIAYEYPQNFQPQQIVLQPQQQYYTYYTPVAHQSSVPVAHQSTVPSMQVHSNQGIPPNQYVPAQIPENQHCLPNTSVHGPNITPQQIPQQEFQQLPLQPPQQQPQQQPQRQPQQQQFHTLDFVTARRSSIATSYNGSIAETCETAGPISQSDHILDALTEDFCSRHDDDDYRNDLTEQFKNLDYDSLGECDINEDEEMNFTD